MTFLNNEADHLAMSGAERIAGERWRQVEVEGHGPDHDATHNSGELLAAAKEYLAYADWIRRYPDSPMSGEEFLAAKEYLAHADHGFRAHNWPWALADFKPADYVRNLEKAGALIAAEIDRVTI